ncbi:HU family DNA-binding protein [Mesosutterella sp. OilRF-GAM-744-9]|uniref:HU family DNA-binding protein n=2 Tax=Mesosutterella TaxID=2494213 RepID=A0ABS9MTX4_9BURK|nr:MULTISPECIES: HU family DNA-binding protein [unclassified Mesosutterella]MCG5031463.1 HU family DNA-binding protein [Mesosutterella sp. oilRF-744-WT-GAM-9]MCI6529520.1 HU family DNA-binding protein [Mesosutterella sp.]MDL2059584.1 HU family DNA-binding protein [Mesosutterella sp. AGMB02718]
MNRQELVDRVAAAENLPKAQAARILETVLTAVKETVKSGDKLTLVGFGTFKLQERPARTGRNPSTGAEIKIPATKVPKFVPGAAFKAAVNEPKKRGCRSRAKARK